MQLQFRVVSIPMATEDGWNAENNEYVCIDGLDIAIKRQPTVKITDPDSKMKHKLLALVPRNGVACKTNLR